MITVDAAVQLLSRGEPTLGRFQCLLAFPDGTFRAVFNHGSRPFDNFAAVDKWLSEIANPPCSPLTPVNPS